MTPEAPTVKELEADLLWRSNLAILTCQLRTMQIALKLVSKSPDIGEAQIRLRQMVNYLESEQLRLYKDSPTTTS